MRILGLGGHLPCTKKKERFFMRLILVGCGGGGGGTGAGHAPGRCRRTGAAGAPHRRPDRRLARPAAAGAAIKREFRPAIVGDGAAYADPRPKSGLFAVRAGPPPAENLRAVCAGQTLKPWQPQRRALYLLSTGDRQALAAWGGLSAGGTWAWRWKDRIDRRFMAQFGA